MWTVWETIHESYGLPRAAQECRTYLQNHGIQIRLRGKKKGGIHVYYLQVPRPQKGKALELLSSYKQSFQ